MVTSDMGDYDRFLSIADRKLTAAGYSMISYIGNC